MKRHSVFRVVPLTVAMIALLGASAGCGEKKAVPPPSGSGPTKTRAHNLEFVQCSSKNGEGNNVTIEVTPSPQVLKDEDRLIFVCPGEMVSWHTANPKTTIEIHFKDKGKAAKLFKKHEVDLDSVPGNGDAATPPKEVADKAESDLSHAYTIIVKQAGNTYEMDPHIIPVGN